MKKTKIIIAVIALVAVIAAAVALWWFTRPETQAGTKTFTVTVVHGDGGEKTFTQAAQDGARLVLQYFK